MENGLHLRKFKDELRMRVKYFLFLSSDAIPFARDIVLENFRIGTKLK